MILKSCIIFIVVNRLTKKHLLLDWFCVIMILLMCQNIHLIGLEMTL